MKSSSHFFLRFQIFSFLQLAAFAFIFSSCSEDKKPAPKPQEERASFFRTAGKAIDMGKIRLMNGADEPMPNAKVLFGTALNTPIENNFLVSDSQGEVTIPQGFDFNGPLTVDAPGYVRQTIYGFRPEDQIVRLNKKAATTKFELNGQVLNLPVENSDGQIDFGLVMPALNRNALLNFDISTVLSPYSDTITVVGQTINIPTNVSLPTQKERYFLSITLEKPIYKMLFNEPGTRKLFAAKGRFPFKTVVEEMRNNKQFFELINYFTLSGGAIRDVDIVNNVTKLDFPSNELSFTGKKSFKSPNFNKDEVFISLSAADLSGSMIPTDIKKVEANKTQILSTLTDHENYLVAAILRANEFGDGSASPRMSASLKKFDDGMTPTLLPLIENPVVQDGGKSLQLPTIKGASQSIQPMVTAMVLSTVQESKQGQKVIETLERQWEVYAKGWQSRLNLPIWPGDTKIDGKKRWEINFVGSDSSSISTQATSQFGISLVNSASHVTHSSVDFN